MKNLIRFLALITIFVSCSRFDIKNMSEEEIKNLAAELSKKIIIVDTHIDLPYRLLEHMEDVTMRTEGGNFDYPRALEGGLNAPFMSIYIPASFEGTPDALNTANKLIDLVDELIKNNPDKFAYAFSPDDVRENFEKGLISLPMGMENGSPIGGEINRLEYFYKRGIRYITLAHSKSNHICDSSYDEERQWHGLSPFGKELVKAMNNIGMMIDVSHITDEAFYQVIEISKTPVIASHSCCRFFTPGWERNMSDDMIIKLAEKGGVIQIAFGSSFVDGGILEQGNQFWSDVGNFMKENDLKRNDPLVEEFIKQYREEHPRMYSTVSKVVDHIDHVVKIAGIDHVGIGSDFDGLGDSLPAGLKDVSMYPNIIYELLKRGYSEEDIEKICSGNLLRVWQSIQDYSEENM